jgi:hypothetical protein
LSLMGVGIFLKSFWFPVSLTSPLQLMVRVAERLVDKLLILG